MQTLSMFFQYIYFASICRITFHKCLYSFWPYLRFKNIAAIHVYLAFVRIFDLKVYPSYSLKRIFQLILYKWYGSIFMFEKYTDYSQSIECNIFVIPWWKLSVTYTFDSIYLCLSCIHKTFFNSTCWNIFTFIYMIMFEF